MRDIFVDMIDNNNRATKQLFKDISTVISNTSHQMGIEELKIITSAQNNINSARSNLQYFSKKFDELSSEASFETKTAAAMLKNNAEIALLSAQEYYKSLETSATLAAEVTKKYGKMAANDVVDNVVIVGEFVSDSITKISNISAEDIAEFAAVSFNVLIKSLKDTIDNPIPDHIEYFHGIVDLLKDLQIYSSNSNDQIPPNPDTIASDLLNLNDISRILKNCIEVILADISTLKNINYVASVLNVGISGAQAAIVINTIIHVILESVAKSLDIIKKMLEVIFATTFNIDQLEAECAKLLDLEGSLLFGLFPKYMTRIQSFIKRKIYIFIFQSQSNDKISMKCLKKRDHIAE